MNAKAESRSQDIFVEKTKKGYIVRRMPDIRYIFDRN